MRQSYNREKSFSEKYDARVAKFGTNDVIPLWVADMDLPTSPAIEEALLKRLKHPIFGYHYYHDNYFQAIIRWMKVQHNWHVRKEAISPINAIVSALHIAVETFTNKGDAVLIQTPIYPPFMHAITHQKRRILDNTLVLKEDRYTIDFEDFARKAKEAKLFLFCSPHNPTGRVWSKEELRKIATICHKENVIIISDEVHADLSYHKRHIPIASMPEAKENTITLNAPSKTFNIASIVNAYAIIDNSTLRREFLTLFKRYALINPNPLSITATIAAHHDSDHWLNERKAYLWQNLRFINDKLDKMTLIKPCSLEATFLLWLDCRALGLDDASLAAWFIQEAKLGLNPGVSFGDAGKGFMRLNFAHPREALEKALLQLEAAYKKR